MTLGFKMSDYLHIAYIEIGLKMTKLSERKMYN